MKYVFGFFLMFLTGWFCDSVLALETDTRPAWHEDFSNFKVNSAGRKIPAGWELRTKLGTAASVFDLSDDRVNNRKVLRMISDKSTGTFLCSPEGVDLKKYPIVRWCWRVNRLPDSADGRVSDKDDQAIGVYIGTGRLSQESVAYRWETLTPKGADGKVSYGGGFVSVKWIAVRNKDDKLSTWYVETRNVAEDFKKAYDYIPKRFGVSVVSNSQNTGTVAEAELAWIEFLPLSAVNDQVPNKE